VDERPNLAFAFVVTIVMAELGSAPPRRQVMSAMSLDFSSLRRTSR
jgi:hypothetical protein